MKKLLLAAGMALAMFSAQAQLKIGLPSGAPNSSSVLDLSNTAGANKGLLLPSVALTGTASASPLAAHVAGMIVYNTATAGNVVPGIYVNNGAQWSLVTLISSSPSSGGTSIISAPDCSGAVSGTLTVGTPASGVTKLVSVNVGTTGTYNIATATVNGITFSASGTFASTGTQNVTLTASGTPTAPATNSYTLNTTPGCSFNATAVPAPAVFAAGTLNCGGAQSGTYQIAVATGATNTKVVTITTTTGGAYTASTNTVNGVTFSTSGTAVAGATSITLVASGTPTAEGTFTYTTTVSGQTCTFDITYAPAAIFACAGATRVQSGTSLINGTAYTGSYTIPYTAGNDAAYTTASQTITGLTLTRAPGTFAAGGGNVVYNLTGTFTGTTGAVVTFPITECAGTVLFGDRIAANLVASKAAYDAAPVNTWVLITTGEYDNLAISSNVAGATEYGGTSTVGFSGTNYGNNVGTDDNFNLANPAPANTYIYACEVIPSLPATGGSFTYQAKFQNSSTGIVTNFPTYGTVTPSVSFTGGTRYCFVLKQSTAKPAATSKVGGFMFSVTGIRWSGSTGSGRVHGGTNAADGVAGPPVGSTDGAEIAQRFLGTATKNW